MIPRAACSDGVRLTLSLGGTKTRRPRDPLYATWSAFCAHRVASATDDNRVL